MPRLPAAGSVTATIIASSAVAPPVTKALWPLRRQPPSTFSARVRIAAASEPVCGSLSWKQPIHSPEVSFVRYSVFWRSVPCSWIAAATGELFAAIMLESPPSAAEISSSARA